MRICQKGQNMKKRMIVVLAVALSMTIGCSQTEKQEKGHSSMVITSDNEVVLRSEEHNV